MAAPSRTSRPIVLRMSPGLFFGFLGAAHLLFNIFYLPYGGFGPTIDELCVGAIYTQPVLFGIWAALGIGNDAARAQATAIFFAVLLLSSGYLSNDSPDAMDLLYRVIILLTTAVWMHATRRRRGWRIARPVDAFEAEAPFQFDLKSLLVWTFSWATILVLGRLTWLRLDHPLPRSAYVDFINVLPVFILLFGPAVLLALGLLAEKLLNKFTLASVIAWPVGVYLLLILMPVLDPSSTFTLRDILPLAAGSALATIISVMPVRFAGFRFAGDRACAASK